MMGGAMDLLKSAGLPASPVKERSRDRISPEDLLLFHSDPGAVPPDVRTCDTLNGSDALQDLTADKIYRLFGNRRFN